MSRRWRYPRARRGTLWPLPPPAAAPSPPVWVPPVLRPPFRCPKAGIRRRGWWTVPLPVDQAPAVPLLAARRRPAVRARRGALWWTPPAAAQQATQPPCPSMLTARRTRVTAVRRGRLWSVPPAGAVPAGPQALPPAAIVGRRARTGPPRRGHITAPPLVGLAPVPPAVPPSVIAGRARRYPVVRRGRFHPLPPAQAAIAPSWPPPLLRHRAQSPIRPHRGVIFAVPSAVVSPPGPQALPPAAICRIRRAWPCRARRGRMLLVPLVGAAHPVVTPLPTLTGRLTVVGDLTATLTAPEITAQLAAADGPSGTLT